MRGIEYNLPLSSHNLKQPERSENEKRGTIIRLPLFLSSLLRLFRRVDYTSNEQDGAGLNVADEEDERAVDTESYGVGRHSGADHDYSAGGSGLCTGLVH